MDAFRSFSQLQPHCKVHRIQATCNVFVTCHPNGSDPDDHEYFRYTAGRWLRNDVAGE